MPSTSAKQAHFFRAIAHSPEFADKVGVKQAVGRDFEAADKRAGKFAMGGITANPFPATHHVDAALHLAGQMARPKFADGGYSSPHPGFGEISDYRSISSPTAGGIIASEIPGRTDHIPTSVAADSYVIPADVVSGLGEGNTLAGARLVQEWMSTGPHGVPLQRDQRRGDNIPRPPQASPYGGRTTTTYSPGLASGGTAHRQPLKTAHIKNDPNEVPVIVAGGEMLLDPHTIAYHPDLGHLDPNDRNPAHYKKAINFGHRVLDSWVKLERSKHIKTLQGLPGPAR
jgi:hypothetical protein